jgi:Ca-activated chloride channel family protein
MKFDVRSDRAFVRAAGGSRRYVLASFTAPEAPADPKQEGRRPVNVSFVLDRSGSMEGESKIDLVREAAEKAIGMLRDEDIFNLVIYDDQVEILMEPTHASAEAKRAARRKLDRISARGSTNLGGGWLTGCDQSAQHLTDSVPAKCLLLTDGLANQGITDPGELAQHAAELRQRGILTSTFGVGRDFDEVLLQNMADAGGGHSYYVEKAVQIPDFLTSELGETLEIVARDAALQLTLPAGVEARPLNRYRHSRSGDTVNIDLGNLVSGQEMAVVVELRFPAGSIDEALSVSICLKDREGVLDAAPAALNWTFADHAVNDKQARDRVVDNAVAELHAAIARDRALEFNRRGDFDSAKITIKNTADLILGYAGDDQSLNGIANVMFREASEYARAMPAPEMKDKYYGAHHSMRNRDAQGKSRKRNS